MSAETGPLLISSAISAPTPINLVSLFMLALSLGTYIHFQTIFFPQKKINFGHYRGNRYLAQVPGGESHDPGYFLAPGDRRSRTESKPRIRRDARKKAVTSAADSSFSLSCIVFGCSRSPDAYRAKVVSR